MAPNSRTKRSEFARALAALLDDTNVMTRDRWAEQLEVTTQAISQWVNDATVPRPEKLRLILGYFREASDQRAMLRDSFVKMATKPASEVSPNAERFGASVSEYMLAPLYRGFRRRYEPLTPVAKETVLDHSIALCIALANVVTLDREETENLARIHMHRMVFGSATNPPTPRLPDYGQHSRSESTVEITMRPASARLADQVRAVNRPQPDDRKVSGA